MRAFGGLASAQALAVRGPPLAKGIGFDANDPSSISRA
jgi:hypothetical protein